MKNLTNSSPPLNDDTALMKLEPNSQEQMLAAKDWDTVRVFIEKNRFAQGEEINFLQMAPVDIVVYYVSLYKLDDDAETYVAANCSDEVISAYLKCHQFGHIAARALHKRFKKDTWKNFKSWLKNFCSHN